MEAITKQCQGSCKLSKEPHEFYRRTHDRSDPVCKDCRKRERRAKYQKGPQRKVAEQISLDEAVRSRTQCESFPSQSSAFKYYNLPNGTCIQLTPEEFARLVDWFRVLQASRDNGRKVLDKRDNMTPKATALELKRETILSSECIRDKVKRYL